MATTCYLPQEIIFIILSFMPVKSLVRFIVVCKSWQSIISNSHFIQAHLKNSEKKQPSSVLNFQVVDNVVYIDTREGEGSVKLRVPPKYCEFDCNICSCNGLVCLAGFSRHVIWNPSTRRFKILPAPKNQSEYYEPIVGFGFDPISSDYKILRIVYDFEFYKFLKKFELYSANDDSWKDIEFPQTLQRLFIPSTPSKCVYTKNGVVYVEGSDNVLSFDLQNEVFGFYMYPGSTEAKSRIFSFEGSVAVILESVRDKGSVPSLWMLDDVCGKLSWTKKFNLDLIHEKDYNVECLYLGVGQYVVLNDVGYIYYDYGSRNKEIKKFDPPRKCTSIINYTESLVSLKGFEKQE